jgi:quinol-cytochrome oxidoreductase complex cytochrome b subunit
MAEDTRSLKDRLLYTSSAPNDDRNRMRTVANNLILHIHPTKVPLPALRLSYTWGLGGISALLATLLVITGVMLMFRYDASVERAYVSIQTLETQVAFGSLLRAVHHWSANLLIVAAFLHLVRVFLTGGFKRGRGGNWLLGLVLLLMVVAFNFTGYLLPWDQLAFWAITVGASLLDYIPLLGPPVSKLLLGGPEVGQAALRNFYAIHVAVLPALLILAMSFHFWKVRKDGGISQPEGSQRVEKVTTIPHLVQIEMAAAALLLALLFIWSMLVPAPLEALANPSHPPNPAKAAWYFMGVQELLLHMHPLAALLLPGILFVGIALVYRLDDDDSNIGVYFRSQAGRWAAVAGALLSLVLTPLLVIADEWWIDLPALLPSLPTLISNGLIPLLLTLLGLAAIYGGLRWLLRTTRSEALVGLFSFVMTSLVLLTVIGVLLRGPNMALTWAF